MYKTSVTRYITYTGIVLSKHLILSKNQLLLSNFVICTELITITILDITTPISHFHQKHGSRKYNFPLRLLIYLVEYSSNHYPFTGYNYCVLVFPIFSLSFFVCDSP